MVEEDSQGITDSLLADAGSVAGAGASTSGTTQTSDPNQPGPSRALESQGQQGPKLTFLGRHQLATDHFFSVAKWENVVAKICQ